MQMATIPPSLFLLIFLWSTELGAEGQEVHFGPCLVQRAILRDLWRAFQAMKNTVQALDHDTDTRLLRQEFLRNASRAEMYHLTNSLLDFYLGNIFSNYYPKADRLGILPPFTTLANNFFAIVKKLKRCKEKGMLPSNESAQRKFELFQQEFTKLNPEVRLTKALGEVDILLTWMEKAFH
ncbi:interleukin-24 [Gracilinanus agilis]|uniref:interleukin-24 n=1 Tax=Gracilinanus agilis TaxID=191870 RepID=UPI001CFDAD58|nr:interleukin-24 [Gracilinanus agilis]